MKPLTKKQILVLAALSMLLAFSAPIAAQTDFGCRTQVAPSAVGRPRPVFTDFIPEEVSVERCILDKMTWTTGIMTGCDVDKFCPSTALTRQEMAVYLLNGLYPSTPLQPQAPFPPAVGIFDDVPADYPLACWIERFKETGITAGCGANRYCPSASVTRDQMAVFVVAARHYLDNPPWAGPQPCQGIFADVPCSSGFAPWIEQAFRDGITAGCAGNPLRYCPDRVVTRWEMTVFLYAAFIQVPCI